jgi:hypothetical protein
MRLVIFAAGHMNDNMTFLGWYQVKLFIEHVSGISMDALHILVGFAIFLLAAQVLRRSVANPLPWAATLLLAVGNEIHDLTIELWPNLGSQLGEGAKDILLTMALPTLLTLTARSRPMILGSDAAHARLANDQVTDRT